MHALKLEAYIEVYCQVRAELCTTKLHIIYQHVTIIRYVGISYNLR